MESTNNNNNNNINNNQMFLCEFKELRNKLSAMKKRIDQLEKSHEKQQEKIDVLKRENHSLKTQLNLSNGMKESGSVLKRKRTDQVHKEETESKNISVSASTGKKKTKTNNSDDDKAVMIPQCDNGDSFDSLNDDLLQKIVEFDGNCYTKFGLINKRCRNIYDAEEYKLKKQTCVYGYGTLEMILQRYLQKRREEAYVCSDIVKVLIWYNRFDAIEWIIQLGDDALLSYLCSIAAEYRRINILTKVFVKCNLTMLNVLLNDTDLCFYAAWNGELETLKWVRKYGAEWDAETFIVARDEGHDDIVQYLHAEGCPEKFDDEP